LKHLFLTLAALLTFAGASFAQSVPQYGHVFVVMEENHSYSSVIGSSSMPYLNSLATKYGLGTKYYANTHPSIGNYFMLTTGQVITNNDSYMTTVTADNMVRHLMTAGKTWKSYAESLPSVGYTGGDTGAYVRHHNPFSYFSDVVNSASEKLNLVPYTQFAADLANNQLPNFSFIVPNLNDDAHNGTLAQADSWLKTNIAPLLASPVFQQDGLLIIVFDESSSSDTAYGGGQVAMVMISGKNKAGYKSAGLYQHQNLLRTTLDALGVTTYPGAAANAADMADFFGTSAPAPTPTPTPTPGTCSATTVGVTVCSPTPGSSNPASVHVSAAATSTSAILATAIYVDNTLAFKQNVSSVDTYLTMTTGSHYVVVQAWDSAGHVYKTPVTISVTSTTTTAPVVATCSASTTGVTVCSPTTGTSDSSPVHVTAAASSPAGIVATAIYVDNTLAWKQSVSSVDTYLNMASGSHYVVVQSWDANQAVYKTPVTISVP
jgi:acid phosphatase